MDQKGYKPTLKELQANIKRSKLEHRELEYEFQKLILERNDCDRSAMKAFRNKYNSVLEEDKRRIARNEKIKQMLERIDYQAAALAAKSERLKMLKTHYEKNLYRAFGPNSSRTDNLSDRHPVKHRTKSVDAHTQIPRPNYEVFEVDDALNNRNYVPTVRESRSVSTSRLHQMDANPIPHYDQRSIRFSSDVSVNNEIDKDLAPAPTPAAEHVNKGVRLFYGHELMNLPDLKVDNEAPVQDSKIMHFERPPEDVDNPNFATETTKTKYSSNVDNREYQNPYPQVGINDLHNSEHVSSFQSSPQYQENKFQESDPKKQPAPNQLQPQYQDNSKREEVRHNQPIRFSQPPFTENLDINNTYQHNAPHKTAMRQAPYPQYQLTDNNQSTFQPPYSQYQVNKNTEGFPVNAPYLQNSAPNNQASIQNTPLIDVKNVTSDDAPNENSRVVLQNNNMSENSAQPESTDRLESNRAQENYRFTPNTIPEVKPILSNQIETAQLNRTVSPKPPTKILESPSIIPQGIHQVWEKVVDVEIVNQPTKSYPGDSNEPRNDVIDKIYKEISSLGEIPAEDKTEGIIKPPEIDNRAEIIDKIEEHYYGEKIQAEGNAIEEYETKPDQSEIQTEQINESQLYQNTNVNYETPNPNNDVQQVEYQNYDPNQQYYTEQEGLSDQQDNNYAPVEYNMEQQQMNDPNYVYGDNENYQNYATDPGYRDEQPDPANYAVDENFQQPQQYTDEMQSQYYEQQQANNDEYVENPNGLIQEQSNEVYNQNMNYDQSNLNPEGYAQYNENAPEMYQDYQTEQQQIETNIPYDYNEYTQNDSVPVSDQYELPPPSEQEEIPVNQIEQIVAPVATKPFDLEIKSDNPAASKPQTEPKKKRVNFLDSSDSEQLSTEGKPLPKLGGKDQSDSDFEFSVKSN